MMLDKKHQIWRWRARIELAVVAMRKSGLICFVGCRPEKSIAGVVVQYPTLSKRGADQCVPLISGSLVFIHIVRKFPVWLQPFNFWNISYLFVRGTWETKHGLRGAQVAVKPAYQINHLPYRFSESFIDRKLELSNVASKKKANMHWKKDCLHMKHCVPARWLTIQSGGLP